MLFAPGVFHNLLNSIFFHPRARYAMYCLLDPQIPTQPRHTAKPSVSPNIHSNGTHGRFANTSPRNPQPTTPQPSPPSHQRALALR
mmetsp:Transcript_140561/g.244698  ORF Transcript_140561/g.244698 Transcript_140561/m.244698 type:complete len:86 (-) Transcript_140561:67-324(-)